MKKLIITTAIVLGLSLTTFADGGGMFNRANSNGSGTSVYQDRSYFSKADGDPVMPGLPVHGQADSQNAPLGSGIVLLTALGAAYAVAKKRNEE